MSRVAPPPPVAGMVAFEVLYWALLTAVLAGPIAVVVRVLAPLPSPWNLLLIGPAVPLVLAGVLVQIGLLRVLGPRLEAGTHEIPGSRGGNAWMYALLLRRVALHPWWCQVVLASPHLRWLALTALGGRTAYRTSMSSDVVLLDPGLLRYGRGCILGSGSVVASHMMQGGTLVLGAVEIADGAEIHALVGIGPGTRVGPRARVMIGARLIADVEIGEDAVIGPESLLQAGSRVGAGARLGARCVLERGAVVPAGANVPAGTRVGKDSTYVAA